MGLLNDKKASDISYGLAKLGKDVLGSKNNSMHGGVKAAVVIGGASILAVSAVVGGISYLAGKAKGKKQVKK